MLVVSDGDEKGSGAQWSLGHLSFQAGAAAHRATHGAWAATALKHHENGAGDPNHHVSHFIYSAYQKMGTRGHIYISGSEMQWRTSQPTARLN